MFGTWGELRSLVVLPIALTETSLTVHTRTTLAVSTLLTVLAVSLLAVHGHAVLTIATLRTRLPRTVLTIATGLAVLVVSGLAVLTITVLLAVLTVARLTVLTVTVLLTVLTVTRLAVLVVSALLAVLTVTRLAVAISGMARLFNLSAIISLSVSGGSALLVRTLLVAVLALLVRALLVAGLTLLIRVRLIAKISLLVAMMPLFAILTRVSWRGRSRVIHFFEARLMLRAFRRDTEPLRADARTLVFFRFFHSFSDLSPGIAAEGRGYKLHSPPIRILLFKFKFQWIKTMIISTGLFGMQR